MFSRKVLLSVAVGAFSLLAAHAAVACEGKTVIFEDKFEDDFGGWDPDKTVTYDNSAMNARMASESLAWSELNNAFAVHDADICVETVFPTTATENSPGLGLIFWALDYNNYYLVMLQYDGSVALFRFLDKKFNQIYSQQVAGLKKSPGASNTIRVKLKGNLVSMYVNGTKIRDQRVQAPTTDARFGVYARRDKGEKPVEGQVFVFKNFKVTSAD